MSVWNGMRVSWCCDSVKKINPNGVDLVPIEIKRVMDTGNDTQCVDVERYAIKISEKVKGHFFSGEIRDNWLKVEPDEDGFYNIPSGVVVVRLPKVKIPTTAVGIALPRSTFNRWGIIKCESALWDSGYEGEGSVTFFFPLSAKIHKDEAWIQLILLDAENPTEQKYEGQYQGEKVNGN
jgi:deoxycytidine triphosphate deaminase